MLLCISVCGFFVSVPDLFVVDNYIYRPNIMCAMYLLLLMSCHGRDFR